jgi:hypothetical protein
MEMPLLARPRSAAEDVAKDAGEDEARNISNQHSVADRTKPVDAADLNPNRALA